MTSVVVAVASRQRWPEAEIRHDLDLLTGLDPLGDLEFSLACQQLDRAHFAHVHAHRVCSTAELAVHGDQGGRGFLGGIIVGGLLFQAVIRILAANAWPRNLVFAITALIMPPPSARSTLAT